MPKIHPHQNQKQDLMTKIESDLEYPKQNIPTKTIQDWRRDWRYRFFEMFVGITSILFLVLLISLAFWNSTVLAIFLILFSFFITLKSALHIIYTIQTFKTINMFKNIDWSEILGLMKSNPEEASSKILQISNQFPRSISWKKRWMEFAKNYTENIDTKFQNPLDNLNVIIITTYNESLDTVEKCAKEIYESGYPLEQTLLVIAREERAGEEFNNNVLELFQKNQWSNVQEIHNDDLSQVYKDFGSYESVNTVKKPLDLDNSKLQVLLTKHPADLSGEIMGKGSNEDWAGRQISLFLSDYDIDIEKVIVTVLDCDSRISRNFLQILNFNFCLTQDKFHKGFQHVPVFSNNFFDSNVIAAVVGAGTTSWNMVQSSLPDEIHFFSNYSIPLLTLQKANFWIRDMIAEDSLLYYNCFCAFKGNFKVVPVFSSFESDVIIGENFGEILSNQYKQLQRWAWGGVEGISFLGRKFFLEPNEIEIRHKIRTLFLEWVGHFYWTTLSITFSYILFLPSVINAYNFNQSYVNQNLIFFGQTFSFISYFLIFFTILIVTWYIKSTLVHRNKKLSKSNYLDIAIQMIVTPVVFLIWFLPPITAQWRGITGQYLGYFVTPKK
jgi:Glycosyl transferase family group 2